jgi:hypothetical protein
MLQISSNKPGVQPCRMIPIPFLVAGSPLNSKWALIGIPANTTRAATKLQISPVRNYSVDSCHPRYLNQKILARLYILTQIRIHWVLGLAGTANTPQHHLVLRLNFLSHHNRRLTHLAKRHITLTNARCKNHRTNHTNVLDRLMVMAALKGRTQVPLAT